MAIPSPRFRHRVNDDDDDDDVEANIRGLSPPKVKLRTSSSFRERDQDLVKRMRRLSPAPHSHYLSRINRLSGVSIDSKEDSHLPEATRKRRASTISMMSIYSMADVVPFQNLEKELTPPDDPVDEEREMIRTILDDPVEEEEEEEEDDNNNEDVKKVLFGIKKNKKRDSSERCSTEENCPFIKDTVADSNLVPSPKRTSQSPSIEHDSVVNRNSSIKRNSSAKHLLGLEPATSAEPAASAGSAPAASIGEEEEEEENTPPPKKNLTIDLSLLRNVDFAIFATAVALSSLGRAPSTLFVVDFAITRGVDKHQAALLLSVMGISDMIGRITWGFVSDFGCIKRVYGYCLMIASAGFALAFWFVARTYPVFVLMVILFGYCAGAYQSVMAVILVDILGLDKISSSFGLTVLFQGVAIVAGPPIAGAIRDATGSYVYSFLWGGGIMVLGAVIILTRKGWLHLRNNAGRERLSKMWREKKRLRREEGNREEK